VIEHIGRDRDDHCGENEIQRATLACETTCSTSTQEAANNAAAGGGMIPLLSLGLPFTPSTAVLLSVTCPLAPGASDSVAGVAFSVKSLPEGPAAVTVNETGMLVLRVPDAPCTLTVVVPRAASAAAVSVNVVLEPMATVAVAGDTVTPVGSPLTETSTDPVKLFALFGVTVNV